MLYEVITNNDNVAILKRNELVLKTIDDVELTPKIQEIQMDLGEIEKNGFEHFMLKEIFEQPKSIKDTFRGRRNNFV